MDTLRVCMWCASVNTTGEAGLRLGLGEMLQLLPLAADHLRHHPAIPVMYIHVSNLREPVLVDGACVMCCVRNACANLLSLGKWLCGGESPTESRR